MKLTSPFLQELEKRGFLHQCTNLEGLDTLTAKEAISFYIGYDATAPSLHVGNLLQIMLMRIGQKHGHTPIVIMGGATTKLGDPTWKDTARPLLDEALIESNLKTIQGVFQKFLRFEGKNKAHILNNNDWFKEIRYLDLLRDIGRYISINRMLTFDSIKMRLDRQQSLTFLEFNYMILQAYDFLHLHKAYDCRLECGGSDQWGNIVSGTDLIHRLSDKEVFGLTCPLLTTSSGQKMGKTEKGAVWLNEDSLSPYDYWQFWRNTEDEDVIKLLKIFTDRDPDELDTYKNLKGAELNTLKVMLADEATTLAHGQDALPAIHQTVQKLFSADTFELSVSGKDEKGNPILASSLPVIQLSHELFKAGIPLLQLLVDSGLVKSNGEARRLIRGNGCSLNGQKMTDENYLVITTDLKSHGTCRLSSGKKNHVLVQSIVS